MSENDETENENANESEEKLARALAAPAAPCPLRGARRARPQQMLLLENQSQKNKPAKRARN